MKKAICYYVRWIDRLNHAVGRLTMCLIFVMMGVLFCSSLSKTFFTLAL